IICLSWYPVVRDSFFYLLSIFAIIIIIFDDKVYWYEALVLLILYGLYILTLCLDSKVQSWVYSKSFILVKIGLINSDQLNLNSYENMINSLTRNDMTKLTYSNTFSDAFEIQSQRDDLEKQFDTDDRIENYNPFELPSSELSLNEKIKFYICWPLFVILFLTIPDCRKVKWQKYYLITFAMSLIWLSIFSYIMVWMITVIGYTLFIPDTIMGITLIAFGASVPDALSSLLVAKNGQGDMAISNAIGSNVFDILVCLGLPWFFRSLTMSEDFIRVKSKGLMYSSITLFGTVLMLILALRLNKWQLDKRLGMVLIIIYILFILLASLYEMNIFGSSNLPMCTNSLWILIPKRNCSLEHLSNLGLILVGTASDLQEFQSQIDDLYEIHIDKYWMEYVYFIFLGIWTWSLFILVVNLDRSDPSPSHVASHPIDRFVQNLHFKIFFIDYNSYFFLAKNLIAILVGIVHLFRSTANKDD
ncbi:unnamed protein product, partial [Brachionus calyciflorus]